MTLHEIPRVKAGTCVAIAETQEVNPQIKSLAQRAKDLLGYVGLHANVTGSRLLGKTTGPLTEALLKLEIEPLDTGSVVKYQCEEMARKSEESICENFSQYTSGYFTTATWDRTRLDKYERPVPEFVINKAIQIKEAVPEVTFSIQHMSDPKADPFLLATLNGEVYYIEAWDEPRFEGTL